MKHSVSRALVPVLKKLPALVPKKPALRDEDDDGFDLVRTETHLRNRAQVERFLPDILGRALARIWIDPVFRSRFADDPKGTLSAYEVHLPASISIDFVTEGVLRPQVVVYETKFPGGPRHRMLYLQLVMMAGK